MCTFLQLHSFYVTVAAEEEQEEDAGAECMGERGPGSPLNGPTKGKKMVQCYGN